ncbi:uncharacterized protein isoform X2 [Leptinotarsa decemlineata]|uniref:uncharacterized protein isoform X2 n=1 Tax=Leptinotarsa decemlineata TaxID=7539 RepID=UPI003D30AC76
MVLPRVPEGFTYKGKANKNKEITKGSSQVYVSREKGPTLRPSNSEAECERQSFSKNQFEMQVLRKLTCLSLKVDQICTDIGSLQELLMERREKESVTNEPLYEFPIDTIENFEKFLEIKENYEKFVAYLGKIGGTSEYEFIKRIYSRVVINEVAREFNWHGLKGKREIRNTLMAKASIEATMCNPKFDTSEKNIELAIKSWLRHAKDRLAKKKTQQEEKALHTTLDN